MQSDLIEFFPTGKKQQLERKDLIVYKYMLAHASRAQFMTAEDLFYAIKESGVDDELVASGCSKLCIRGRKDYTTMIGVLNNLWWDGKVSKFGKGIYERTGRPYGVVWIIE